MPRRRCAFRSAASRPGGGAETLFQDLDANGRLDRNPFGVPSEPWGASGKPAPMAAPTWELSQVPVNGGVIVVKLTH